MKCKIINIITGGIKKDGITISQIENLKKFDQNKIQMDFIGNLNSDNEVVKDIQSLNSNVYILPDRQKNTFMYILQLYKFLKKNDYSVIHVHGSSAILFIEMIVSILAGIKVRIVHSRNTLSDNLKLHRILKPLFKNSYTHAFACGEDAGKWLFDNRPFSIIHNGKDFSRFKFSSQQRQEIRKKLDLEEKIVIGHVGKLNKQKNHEYLFDVFEIFRKKHSNAILYLMGNGEMNEKLQKLAIDKNIEDSVVFAGSINDVDVRLQAMDIMVFPSLFEGLPNVVLEWQAVGLPCLISDKITRECAPSDLVEFMSIDLPAEKWSDKVEKMLNKKTDRELDAQIATQRLKEENFDIDINAKKMQDMYIEFANNIKNKR